MLSIKNIRASLASFIAPPNVRPIPDIGTPAMRIVSQAAPVAARPVRTVASPAMHDAFKLYEEQLRLDFDLESKLALAATPDASRQIRAAFSQFRASKLRGKTIADIAKTPFALRPAGKAAPKSGTVDDEGSVPVDTEDQPASDFAEIVKTLEGILEDLKSRVTLDESDKTDEATARAAAKSGRHIEAVNKFSDLATRLQAKDAARKSRSALLAQPSSRERAAKLTASGFNNDPVVAQLNQALGRGGLSLADRASLALAPVAGRTPPAPRPAAATSRSDSRPDVVKINSLRAEIAQLDREQRKQFSNDRHARHSALSRELKAELRKFHVQ